jgi:hypothetical protein
MVNLSANEPPDRRHSSPAINPNNFGLEQSQRGANQKAQMLA